MKKSTFIGDSGVTEKKDYVGKVVISANVLIIAVLTVLAILVIINS